MMQLNMDPRNYPVIQLNVQTLPANLQNIGNEISSTVLKVASEKVMSNDTHIARQHLWNLLWDSTSGIHQTLCAYVAGLINQRLNGMQLTAQLLLDLTYDSYSVFIAKLITDMPEIHSQLRPEVVNAAIQTTQQSVGNQHTAFNNQQQQPRFNNNQQQQPMFNNQQQQQPMFNNQQQQQPMFNNQQQQHMFNNQQQPPGFNNQQQQQWFNGQNCVGDQREFQDFGNAAVATESNTVDWGNIAGKKTQQTTPNVDAHVLNKLNWVSSYTQPYRQLYTNNYKVTYTYNDKGIVIENGTKEGLENMSILDGIENNINKNTNKTPKDDGVEVDGEQESLFTNGEKEVSANVALNLATLVNNVRNSAGDTPNVGHVSGTIMTMIYGHKDQELVSIISKANSFKEMNDLMLDYKNKMETTSKLITMIQCEIVAVINSALLNKLGFDSGSEQIAIENLKDVEELHILLEKDYPIKQKSFEVFEREFMASYCKTNDEVEALELFKKNKNATIIPMYVGVTLIDVQMSELELQIDSGEYLHVKQGIHGGLYGLINNSIIRYDETKIPPLHHYIITSDNVVLEVHKALLISTPNSNEYLLQKLGRLL